MELAGLLLFGTPNGAGVSVDLHMELRPMQCSASPRTLEAWGGNWRCVPLTIQDLDPQI